MSKTISSFTLIRIYSTLKRGTHTKIEKEILPNAEIYVYVVENHIVGFIGLDQNYIEGIFIDAHSQSKGIGTLLLNKVKEDRNTLTLSVYKKNVNAIKFYKNNNFIITSESIDKDTNEIEYIMTWVK